MEDYSVIKAVKADTVVVGKVISKTMISNTFNARLHIKTSVWLRGSGDKDMSIIEQNCTREFRSGREYIFLFHKNKLIGSLSYSKENLSTVYGDTKYGS
jgi:hypothetical protein